MDNLKERVDALKARRDKRTQENAQAQAELKFNIKNLEKMGIEVKSAQQAKQLLEEFTARKAAKEEALLAKLAAVESEFDATENA